MIQSAKGPSGSASPDDIRRSATRVLTIEADALAHMAAHLPADFAPAVECMMACTGRVIVAGIGKSGHIGRKIAATLASTGTPSHFVHVAEASHGDLGMLGSHDVCVLISNSGETAEMHDMIYHTQRFSIPLIGISSNASSTLMRAADYRLTLPDRPEACPIGMAPTTSTTLALALGDALAVALMERRGISAADFGVFHPGGKLGAQLRRVSDLMHGGDEIPAVDENTAMSDVLLAMTSHGLGLAVVMRGEHIAGVITDGDLRRNMAGLMERRAIDVANTDPLTVPPDCLASEALAVLNARKVNVLLVADENRKPLGVLHIHDLLRAGVM
nr:KpsF/GutQ family sugar-phosphate isomerase [Roseovarius sp. Pro17]